MTEGRYDIFLDSRRYSEVVEVQRNGQPRMHISGNVWLRFNIQFDLYHNTLDGRCTAAMSQSMKI